MPISEAEAFGPTLSAKRKKSEETGFIESALAGVATGVWRVGSRRVKIRGVSVASDEVRDRFSIEMTWNQDVSKCRHDDAKWHPRGFKKVSP